MLPPLHAILKIHLPRHVRGSVYKGGAVSRSTICLLGLGAHCLLFLLFFRILERFTVWFLPSQVFEKVSKVLLWVRLLASFCKTVRNSLLRLDLVCLGSVAKLLQPKSFAQGFPASICPTNCTSAKANETMRLCGTTWRYSIYSSEYATTPPCNIKAKKTSTTTRQRFCLQGRGSKQIHNLLTGAGS